MRNHFISSFLIGILFLLQPLYSFSFENLDSLKNTIENIKDPDRRLYEIEESLPHYIRARDNEALKYLYISGLELAEQNKRDSSIACILLHQGIDQYFYGNYIEAKEYYHEAIDKYAEIPEEIKTRRIKINEANAYNNLGIIVKKQGLYPIALQNYQIALAIRTKLKDTVQIANTELNIGNLYNQLRNLDKSKEYYLKARRTYLLLGNDFGLASANHNLGLVNEILKDYDGALDAYRKSYVVYKKLKRTKSMGITLNNIGNVFIILNIYDSAYIYLNDALLLYQNVDDSVGICAVMHNLGNYYSNINNDEKAEYYYSNSIEIARNQELIEKEVDISRSLASYHKKKNNYKKAFYYLNLVDELELSYKSDEAEERFQRLDEHYREEANKKNLAIKELELQNSKNLLKSSKNFTILLSAGLLVILLLLAFQLIKYKATNRIKKKLEATNEELKRINREYEQTLISEEEKEILLREIHHRVKNNLQIINSLLRFQAMKGSDESRELILELQTRITAMSLLHEQLYMNKDFSRINVKDYIELLLSNLSSAYLKDYTIDLSQDIKVDNLDLDTLHPLGLLINEIVSNSLKHAFIEDFSDCQIYVNLYPNDDVYYLEIGDNGIGFDESLLDQNDTNNLGIELITSLVKQLDGSIEVLDKVGTHYQICFKQEKTRSKL
jgi:two-component sensor histidine kinase/tetratricopeptide (TPR) repeat protein